MTAPAQKLYDLTQSYELWERAEAVIPFGGVYYTRSPKFVTFGEFPAFITAAEGCRLTDVDGNSYIDLMCAYGPIVLGYNHPAVEAAAAAQQAKGNATSILPAVMVDLAETLVRRWDFADWAVFAKNGSDVTTLATRVARQHTGKTKIVAAHEAYHGFDTWSVPGGVGIPEGHRSDMVYFTWNDVADFHEALNRAGDDLAAVILSPVKHDAGHDIELPTPEFVAAVNDAVKRTGCVFIMDDIRMGFRLHATGASHKALGWQPHLVAYGKALGNGHPIAALVGPEDLKFSTSRVYFSGTHFTAAVPMAAALAVLQAYDTERCYDRMVAAGTRLRDGLTAAAAKAGIGISYTGPVTMPNLLFEDDPGMKRIREWSGLAARRGVIFHPRHNWFVSSAMSDADIDEAVAVAGECFALVARNSG